MSMRRSRIMGLSPPSSGTRSIRPRRTDRGHRTSPWSTNSSTPGATCAAPRISTMSRAPYLCSTSYLSDVAGTLGAHFRGSGEAGKDADEMKVVGLRGYEQEPITENRIRAEHGLPYRNSYAGRCSAVDGTPD